MASNCLLIYCITAYQISSESTLGSGVAESGSESESEWDRDWKPGHDGG